MIISRRGTSGVLLSLMILLGGYNATLPVTDISLPIIFTPIQIVHGIYIDEFLLISYFMLSIVAASAHKFELRTNSYVRASVALLSLLALIGVFSGAVNGYLGDVIKSLRLFYIAIFFVILYDFCFVYGAPQTLRSYLMGSVCGGAINFYYSFSVSDVANSFGVLPRLMGQAGPGVSLGFNIILGLFLVKLSSRRFDLYLALAALLMGGIASVISFSKISLISASLGIGAWCFFAFRELLVSRKWWIPIVLLMACIGFFSGKAVDIYQSAEMVINLKLSGVGVDADSNDNKRYMYHLGVFEIARDNPIIGVGFSGFYDAIQKTSVAGEINEDPESGKAGTSNPHSALLHYLSAMGIPGAVVATTILCLAIFASFRYSRRSLLFFPAVAISLIVIFLTIPNFFFARSFYVLLAVVLVDLDLKVVSHRIVW
jgi:hypothetical protein